MGQARGKLTFCLPGLTHLEGRFPYKEVQSSCENQLLPENVNETLLVHCSKVVMYLVNQLLDEPLK